MSILNIIAIILSLSAIAVSIHTEFVIRRTERRDRMTEQLRADRELGNERD